MGNWQQVVIENGKVGNSATGSYDYETDLPVTGFIGKISLRSRVNKAATSVYTMTNVKVVGNESDTIKSMAGILAQKLYTQFDNKKVLTATSASSAIMRETDGAISAGLATGDHTVDAVYELNFGRYRGDTLCMLPAFAYSTLKLKWTSNIGTAALDAAENFYVICDVYVPSPGEFSGKTVFVLKDNEIKRETYTETSGFKDVTLPLGNYLRRLMLFVETGASDIGSFQLRLNNGSEIPLADLFTDSTIVDMTEYGLTSQDTVCTILDLDRTDDLSKCINLAAYNDAKLRLDLVGAGTYAVVMCEVVPINIQ